jgi:RecA/RadA recombinase
MISLTPKEILAELNACYSAESLAALLNIPVTLLNAWKAELVDVTEDDINNICTVFYTHVQQNKQTMKISELENHIGETIACDTPAGFIPVRYFYKKGDRNCYKLTTETGKTLTCSHDHLVKTSNTAFTKAGDLQAGMYVQTTDGLEQLVETMFAGVHPVYDAEVMSIDHEVYTNELLSHNSGKSFILSNTMAAAQAEGSFVLAIDSENALDYNYLHRVGVDTSEERFLGVGVVTVQDTVKVLSEFIDGYIKEYGKYNFNAPKVCVCIDSLSMLLTEAENDNFESGEQRGDQGQQAKQIKHFLKTMTSRMKMTNMSLAVTAHVYAADPLKGEGAYSVTPALRYACSQIVLITKLRLREEVGKEKEVIGIKLRAETFKSRFAKLGSKVEIEVPYDRGLDPLNGLLDRLIADGVVEQKAAWYTLAYTAKDGTAVERKFMKRDFTPELAALCLAHPKVHELDELFEGFTETDEVEKLSSVPVTEE